MTVISSMMPRRSSSVSSPSIISPASPIDIGTPMMFHHQLGLRKRRSSQNPSALCAASSDSRLPFRRQSAARMRRRSRRCAPAGQLDRNSLRYSMSPHEPSAFSVERSLAAVETSCCAAAESA